MGAALRWRSRRRRASESASTRRPGCSGATTPTDARGAHSEVKGRLSNDCAWPRSAVGATRRPAGFDNSKAHRVHCFWRAFLPPSPSALYPCPAIEHPLARGFFWAARPRANDNLSGGKQEESNGGSADPRAKCAKDIGCPEGGGLSGWSGCAALLDSDEIPQRWRFERGNVGGLDVCWRERL